VTELCDCCVSWALVPQKCVSGWGSAPDPTPTDPVAGFQGATLPAYAYRSAGLL